MISGIYDRTGENVLKTHLYGKYPEKTFGGFGEKL
jgi:hypothetical protein